MPTPEIGQPDPSVEAFSAALQSPIMAALRHWLIVGYTPQSAMVMALAKHADPATTTPFLRAACRAYVKVNTNRREEDLV